MLVFAGLWTQADKAGNFPWRPAQIKLDILPFIEYDLGSSLEALRKTGFISPYTGSDGKAYGHIHNFDTHQRFFGSEVKLPPRYPAFLEEKQNQEVPRNPQGSAEEVPRIVELGIRSIGDRSKGIEEGDLKIAQPAAHRVRAKRNREKELEPEVFRVYEYWHSRIKASSRKAAALKWISRRGSEHGFDRLIMAINRYSAECKRLKTEPKYYKECANFFGEDAAYEGFLPSEEFYTEYHDRALAELAGGQNEEAA